MLLLIISVALVLSLIGNAKLIDRCNQAEREAYFLLRRPHQWSSATKMEALNYGL